MPRAGGNPDSNTLISDMTTVICLDDYHCLDRKGRAEKGVTALAPEAQNFDLMYEQVRHRADRTAVCQDNSSRVISQEQHAASLGDAAMGCWCAAVYSVQLRDKLLTLQ